MGNSIGRLNKKVIDVEFDDSNLPHLNKLIINSTSNTENIPDNFDIYLIMIDKLRIQRFNCGTKNNLLIPKDVKSSSSKIDNFSKNYGNILWKVKFVDSDNFTYAWTISKR